MRSGFPQNRLRSRRRRCDLEEEALEALESQGGQGGGLAGRLGSAAEGRRLPAHFPLGKEQWGL